MCKETRTPDEIRTEMLQKLKENNTQSQYIHEVATPGITLHVNDSELDT